MGAAASQLGVYQPLKQILPYQTKYFPTLSPITIVKSPPKMRMAMALTENGTLFCQACWICLLKG